MSAIASSRNPSARSTRRAKTSPAGVRKIPRGLRANRASPASSSSLRMAWVTAGCETRQAAAVWVTEWVRASAWNMRR